ncbi:MAG TPA: type VII secretion integral membrane protein EccD [Candidatus Stackebrandtia excrementipullorum]|nr:type VII secretion integral membrane protein EccD [Candidatus Stackebrandtia excrementipullorum]
MPGQYSSVTIVGPGATRDMALPSGVPVAELLPPLLDRGISGDAHHDLASWELATTTGHRLAPGQTLSEARVFDGDVLFLHDVTDDVLPAPVEDVRDSVEDHVEATGHRWRAGTGRLYATIIAAIAVLGGVVVPGTPASVVVTGVLVCLSAIVVTWWSAAEAPLLARLSLGAGALWAWRITHLLTENVTPDTAAGEMLRHTYGVWAAVLLMLVTLAGTPLALPFVIGFATVATIATPVAVAMQMDMPVGPTVAVTATILVFGVGLLPRAAMGVGGLLGIDRDIQAGADVREPALVALLDRLDAMLVGAVLAFVALCTVASGVLLLQGDPWFVLLAAGIGLALLTRSRVFDQTRHVAPFRVGGTVVVTACAVAWLLGNPVLLPWAPALVVLAALIYVGLASVPRSTVANATAARVIRFAEIFLVAALIALCGQVTGLYGSIGW